MPILVGLIAGVVTLFVLLLILSGFGLVGPVELLLLVPVSVLAGRFVARQTARTKR